MRAPTVCAVPGCPEDAVHRGRCARHQRRAWARRSPSSRALASSPAHRRARRAALSRTGGRCERCGARPPTRELQLHHPRPISRGGEIVQLDAELLCVRCHRAAHRERR